MPGPLLDCLQGRKSAVPPVWFMRQAGRYLSEYRALRAEKGGFLDLVYDSEAACEVTLQPIRRFGFDGAILFSDILIVPHAMGQKLEFLAGEGPKLSPPLAESELSDLQADQTRYDPIYETVRLCRNQLSPDVTMLGFAGSPWRHQRTRSRASSKSASSGKGGKTSAPLLLAVASMPAWRSPAA